MEDGRPAFRGDTNFENVGLKEYRFHIGPFRLIYNYGLISEIKKFNPDLVILQGIAGDITNRRLVNWAKRRKRKIILWTCGWDSGLAKGYLLKFKNYLVSVFFKKADMHLTYSTKANKYTERMGVAASNITTCYNGLEIDQMVENEEKVMSEAKKIRTKLNLNDHITFIYVGGFVADKKVNLLIEAFAELRKKYKNIKLILIGDGPEKNKIVKQIEDIKDQNISYLGRIIDGVDPYFAASDCLVLPGAGGLAFNQAMFWGKTCIAGVADGTEDDLVIEGKTGYRFIKDNKQSLIKAMERRINTGIKDIEKMSKAAKETIIKKSNVNNMVKIFGESVKQLLKNR
jgi:glycosyltransferase involved in cell wall biosynthesis